MPNLLLSDHEWSFLAGEPSDYLKLYLVVKRRMDFDTRIAGLKTRINETVLRDAYVLDPVQGRAKPKPITRQRYRSGIARLEKLGLLERIGKLVFFFPQAPVPKFAQNNNNQKLGGQQPISVAALQVVNASAGKACEDFNQGENAVPQPKPSDNSNLLPAFRASYLLTSSSPASQTEEEAEVSTAQAGVDAAPSPYAAPAQFPMFLDWQPNRSSLETLASHLGVSLVGFTDEVLARFTAYWTFDEPECQKTQKQWERQLVLHLEHKRQYAEKQAQQAEAKSAKQAAESSPSGVKPEKPRKAASGKVIQLRPAPPSAPVTEKTVQQQEQTMPSVQATDEMMTVLYRKLRGMYGYTFERHYPTENEFSDWSTVLADLSREQVLTGLRRLIDQCTTDPYGAFAPSAIRFRQVCLQITGLPDVKRAWYEAVNAHYSHEAVEHAAKVTGFAVLQSAKSGLLDAGQMRLLRDRFEMSFQQVKERLQRGEPLQGQQVAEHGQKQNRQEAYGEYQRLIQHIQAGELPTACNALRQQAIQARREAQALREQFNFEPLPDAPVSAGSSNAQSIRQGCRA